MQYFGTDGFRGLAGSFLTPPAAFKVGYFLGLNSENKLIIIGQDTRISSDMLSYSLIAGIISSGANCYNYQVISTPCLAYLTRKENCVGIMISASHNPYYDNGIKIIDSKGNKISKEFEQLIEKFIDSAHFDFKTHDKIGRVYIKDGTKEYLSYIKSNVQLENVKYKLLIDCANGANYQIAKKAYEMFNLFPKFINDHPNGININDNCGSVNIDKIEDGGRVLFSFDGDGDRLLFKYNNRVYNGDDIVYILAKYLKYKGELKDGVVLTVMSNLAYINQFEKMGIKTYITPVGDRHIQQVLQQNNLLLGAEQSGHIIINLENSTGDGLFASLKILEATKQFPLEWYDDVTPYPQLLINIEVDSSIKEKIINDTELKRLIDKDNDFLNEKGRIIIRPSGTENKIRIMVEAETINQCQVICNRYKEIIEERYKIKKAT